MQLQLRLVCLQAFLATYPGAFPLAAHLQTLAFRLPAPVCGLPLKFSYLFYIATLENEEAKRVNKCNGRIL